MTLPAARASGERPDLLAELERTAPAPGREDLAVCHGDLCVPNVLLDPRRLAVTALIDLGRLGVADRAADLAVAARSLADTRLNPQYGERSAARFLARYGGPVPDASRLAFYRLLDEFG